MELKLQKTVYQARKPILSYIKQRVLLKHILVTSVTIGFVFTLLYFWLSHQEKELIMEQVKKQTVILHRQIVLT